MDVDDLHLEGLDDDVLIEIATAALGNLAGRFDPEAPREDPSRSLDPDRRAIFKALDAAVDRVVEARRIIRTLPGR